MNRDTRQPAAQGAIAARVADLLCLHRRHGSRELLRRIADRVRSAAWSAEEVVVLVKDLDDVTELGFPAALRIEELRRAHLPALFEFNCRRCDSKANARAVADLERGYRGYVAYVGDELVGYYWWVDRRIDPHHHDIARYGLGIELEDGDVYGFDFFLLEQHRGGGNAMEFLHQVETRLRELGHRRLWGYVVADNKPARWLYGLRGYRPITKVAARRMLTRRVPLSREPLAVPR